MKARKKVAPPITPRIVQTHPGQQVLRYALLFFVFLLAVWFSYDYGRTQAPEPAPANTATPAVPSPAGEQRNTALEQERDALKQKVAELEQRVTQATRATETARARTRSLQQAQPAAREIPVAVVAPAASPPPAVASTLQLENVRLEATDSESLFRLSFSVMHDVDGSGRVTGTIWIAVNGFTDGIPRRLSFKTLSPERRSYVKMGFDQQQDVSEDIVLPDDFHPKNILIEAKPYVEKYTGTALKIDWDTTQ